MSSVISSYTIPIPEPVLPGDLEQLAQIVVPDNKLLVVYWMRGERQAVCNYENEWYIQSDQNILTGIARVIKYEKSVNKLQVDDLNVIEIVGQGYPANADMVHDFRECEWSDYASDRIAFQCTIRETDTPVTRLAAPVLNSSACGCNHGCNMLTEWGL